ncbi:hypothetical protein TNCV_1050551 [Trichonephila clavipes]|nr:hypothetical protein TNCV_1050551 [Trichonephila clavipes]
MTENDAPESTRARMSQQYKRPQEVALFSFLAPTAYGIGDLANVVEVPSAVSRDCQRQTTCFLRLNRSSVSFVGFVDTGAKTLQLRLERSLLRTGDVQNSCVWLKSMDVRLCE